MNRTRTRIKEALFSRLQNATFSNSINGFSTWALTSRRMKLFAKVDKSNQPAMFLVQHKEEYIQGNIGTPGKRYLNMGAWCLAPSNEGDIGDDYLDWMMEGIENALLPDEPHSGDLTLGGLCYWCRIERSSDLFIRDPGDIDGQALLVVPIRICIP